MPEPVSTNLTWHLGTVTRDERQQLLHQKGVIVWLTGLSGSGKSTIAVILEQMLLRRHKHAYRLDGDNVRYGLNNNLGFSEADRTENIRRIGEVAKLFIDAGVIVLASFISPYRKDRESVRAGCQPGEFVEVYVHHVAGRSGAARSQRFVQKSSRGRDQRFHGNRRPRTKRLNRRKSNWKPSNSPPSNPPRQILKYLEDGGYLRAEPSA